MQACSRYFKEAVEAVGSYGPGYQPTSNEQLLVEAVDQLDKELAYVDPTIQRYGSTIPSYGWSDARMHPILNMLLVSADGVKLLDTIDTSGDTKVCTQCKLAFKRDLCYQDK